MAGLTANRSRHLVGLKGLEKLWFTSAIPLTDQQAEYLSRLRNLQLLSLEFFLPFAGTCPAASRWPDIA